MPRAALVSRMLRAPGLALVAGSATYLFFRLLEDLGARFVRPSTPGPFYTTGHTPLLAVGVALLVLLAVLTRPAGPKRRGLLLSVHAAAWAAVAGLLGYELARMLPDVQALAWALAAAAGGLLAALGSDTSRPHQELAPAAPQDDAGPAPHAKPETEALATHRPAATRKKPPVKRTRK